MLVIVTYDVSTETPEGRARLRKVAKTCVKWGQRVQKSVFECRVNQAQMETLERQLVAIMDPETDSIRLYRLTEPVALHVTEHGNVKAVDFDGPLVV